MAITVPTTSPATRTTRVLQQSSMSPPWRFAACPRMSYHEHLSFSDLCFEFEAKDTARDELARGCLDQFPCIDILT
jgi:hypothetical protein